MLLLINISLLSQTKPDTDSVSAETMEVLNDTTVSGLPEGLTAADVIKKYVEAIGGADKIYSIIDRTTIMRGSVQGVNITIVSYQKAPNKIKQEIKAGSSEQELIFNGEKGILKMADQSQEITSSELEKLKYEATLTLLTDPEHHGLKTELEGIEKNGDEEVYKVVMTLPSGIRWTQYYDSDSGLKVKEEKYINSPMGLFQQEITYSDYREVEGMLYPFNIKQSIGSQSMEFNVSSIKINTGLTDREFAID